MPNNGKADERAPEGGQPAAQAAQAQAAARGPAPAPRRTSQHAEAIKLLNQYGGDIWALARQLLVLDVNCEDDLWY